MTPEQMILALVDESVAKFPRMTFWQLHQVRKFYEQMLSDTPLDSAEKQELTEIYEQVFG